MALGFFLVGPQNLRVVIGQVVRKGKKKNNRTGKLLGLIFPLLPLHRFLLHQDLQHKYNSNPNPNLIKFVNSGWELWRGAIVEVFILKIGWVGKLLLDFSGIILRTTTSLPNFFPPRLLSATFPRIISCSISFRCFLPQDHIITMPLVLLLPHHFRPVFLTLPRLNRTFIYYMMHANFFFSFPFLIHTLSLEILHLMKF